MCMYLEVDKATKDRISKLSEDIICKLVTAGLYLVALQGNVLTGYKFLKGLREPVMNDGFIIESCRSIEKILMGIR
jgi:hypothetical protein